MCWWAGHQRTLVHPQVACTSTPKHAFSVILGYTYSMVPVHLAQLLYQAAPCASATPLALLASRDTIYLQIILVPLALVL